MFLQKIRFNANVSDEASGVWRVEFYLDDELNFTDYDLPYEWTWTGSGNHTVTAKVFDWAGHSANSSISTPFIQSHIQNSLNNQQISQFLHNFIILHQIGINLLRD